MANKLFDLGGNLLCEEGDTIANNVGERAVIDAITVSDVEIHWVGSGKKAQYSLHDVLDRFDPNGKTAIRWKVDQKASPSVVTTTKSRQEYIVGTSKVYIGDFFNIGKDYYLIANVTLSWQTIEAINASGALCTFDFANFAAMEQVGTLRYLGELELAGKIKAGDTFESTVGTLFRVDSFLTNLNTHKTFCIHRLAKGGHGKVDKLEWPMEVMNQEIKAHRLIPYTGPIPLELENSAVSITSDKPSEPKDDQFQVALDKLYDHAFRKTILPTEELNKWKGIYKAKSGKELPEFMVR